MNEYQVENIRALLENSKENYSYYKKCFEQGEGDLDPNTLLYLKMALLGLQNIISINENKLREESKSKLKGYPLEMIAVPEGRVKRPGAIK